MTKPNETPAGETQTVLFFDGFCGLCSASVDFMLIRDHKRRLLYSPLQGETARSLVQAGFLSEGDVQDLDSVIAVVYQKKPGPLSMSFTKPDAKPVEKLTRSRAILHCLAQLEDDRGFLAKRYRLVAFLGKLIPVFLSDLVYGLIAKNRFRLLGKRETCRIPTPEERDRFLL
ncbi:MAG: DCC1-like thiol-disulfide oxidoreductase family protein [Bdellovibrionales bacterium]|jgi:predicted DCC family thiol-disulfide oxidoreductase YuxK|nr:DCC1-like thiol-disulfide oxidoreductase family protein [Bdellovibrionales bacterium]